MSLPNLSALASMSVPTGMAPKQDAAATSDEDWLQSQTQRQVNYYRSLDSVEAHADRALGIELTRSDLRDAAIDVGKMLATRTFELVRSHMGDYMDRTQALLDVIARGGQVNHMRATLHLQHAIATMERYLEEGPRRLQAELVDGTEDVDVDEEAPPVLYLEPSAIESRVPDMITACKESLLLSVNLWYQDAYAQFREWKHRYDSGVRWAIRIGALGAARAALPKLSQDHRAICTQMRMAARMRQRVLADRGMGLEDAVQEDLEQIERVASEGSRDLERAGAAVAS